MSFAHEDAALKDQYNAMLKAIDAGQLVDAPEIWDLCQELILAGYPREAERLGEHLPDR